ncbi:MAG: AIPR family protein [Pseudomonadota bacterium]
MTEDIELLNFIQRMNSEVHDRASGGTESDGSVDFKENVFVEYILDHLGEMGIVENPEVCHFERRASRGSLRVNGFAVNDDGDTLDLFASIFLDLKEPLNVTKDEISKAVREALHFFDAAKKGLYKQIETASDAFSMASRIFEVASDLNRARVFVLTDGLSRIKDIKGAKIKGLPVTIEIEIWDVERLFRSMQSSLPKDVIEIDFERMFGTPIPCVAMPGSSEDYLSFLMIMPAEILYRIYDEYGPRLLEFNVRSFLQAKGKVNKGIRDTLKQEPDLFMAYNNGISATADSLQVARNVDGQLAIRTITGIQIVNGAQTTASLHRAKKIDKVDLSSVFVPAKITTLLKPEKLEEIVPKISLYANSQNVIQIADFSANHSFHIEIERFSTTIWCPGEQGRWFYERARGQYQDAKNREGKTPAQKRKFDERTPSSRKFTKTDLAKYINSWDQLPHVVSRGAQKNFLAFTIELHRQGSDWKPDETWYRELLTKAILFKQITRIVRQEKFSAYKANIVTYLIAYLACKSGSSLNLRQIWDNQNISSELERLLRLWSHKVCDAITSSASGRNVTEWCKKVECWESIRKINDPLPDTLPPEWH